uniref:Si:ch73-269m23.5 n=1 Tax=Hucho hucho TaxID=62062 RepID=A0A4W5PK65_9TELE
MGINGRLQRYLLPASIMALLLFLSSFWLPQVSMRDCETSWHPCLSFNFYLPTPETPVIPHPGGVQSGGQQGERGVVLGSVPPLQVCQGQQFQVWRLMSHLTSSMATHSDDVLLEHYLYSWDELIKFMESLGPLVSFFSQKVKDKIAVIRELAQQEKEDLEKRSPVEGHSGLQTPPSGLQGPAAYSSVRSMVESELQRGLVNFSVRTRSGSRNLLRLHRSLLWILLLLQGLGEGPDAQGVYRTPGELCRDAYTVALAPHHPWLIRSAAELVFVALPDRRVFLDIVCVRKEEEVGPVLNIVVNVMREVYTRTQSMLEEHNMMELP